VYVCMSVVHDSCRVFLLVLLTDDGMSYTHVCISLCISLSLSPSLSLTLSLSLHPPPSLSLFLPPSLPLSQVLNELISEFVCMPYKFRLAELDSELDDHEGASQSTPGLTQKRRAIGEVDKTEVLYSKEVYTKCICVCLCVCVSLSLYAQKSDGTVIMIWIDSSSSLLKMIPRRLARTARRTSVDDYMM
jgi:hypothetical protein